MTLHVCAPDIFAGDAVGNHCMGIARTAGRLGMRTQVYAERYDVAMPGVRPLEEVFSNTREDDTVLLSYSIYDAHLERFLALPCRKLCYFHGVTEPALLRKLEPRTADLCEAALKQLPLLAGFDTVIANSRQTAHSLTSVVETRDVQVIPPIFGDMVAFTLVPARARSALRQPNLLMVGRVVPHKRIDDAIELLAELRQHSIDAALTIVGNAPNYDYTKFLINHARALGVLEQVDFKGMLDDADLFDCYDNATALLAMSRHEGFCVPVLEAMHFGKPVFVRGGTAAREICPADCVIDAGASLEMWAEKIASDLRAAPGLNTVNPAYVSHAQGVLERASDEVWRKALSLAG